MLERLGGGGLSFLQENPSKFFYFFLRFPFLDSLKLVLRRLSTLRYIRTLRRLCTASICSPKFLTWLIIIQYSYSTTPLEKSRVILAIYACGSRFL